MRHITFIGSLNSTFASRWKRKLAPESYKEGKELTKKIAKNRDIITPELEKQIIDRQQLINSRKTQYNSLLSQRDDFYSYNGKRTSALDKVLRKNRQEKIEELSKPLKREKVISPPNSLKTSAKTINPSPKVTPNNNPLLKPKKLPLGKIGLGAVGLATIGAVGYGLLRKTRNDKGKKRGSYRR